MSEPGLTPEQQEFLDRQRAEYGRYVANQNIMHDGALAYTKDQAVPASNVERHGYVQLGLVREAGSAAPEPEAAPVPPKGEDIVLDLAAEAAPSTEKPARASKNDESEGV